MLTNAKLADVICNFDVMLFNLILISATRFGRMLIIDKFAIIHILINCPLTIANFGIISTNNALLINAILADVLCNFYGMLFNLILISATRFGRMLIIDKFAIIHYEYGEFINY